MADLAAEFGRACERLEVDADTQQISEKILDRCSILSAETLNSNQVPLVPVFRAALAARGPEVGAKHQSVPLGCRWRTQNG